MSINEALPLKPRKDKITNLGWQLRINLTLYNNNNNILDLYSALSCLRLLKALPILLPGHWRAIQAIAYAAI